MKTSFDFVDIVWQHLNSSSLKTEINGRISKGKRIVNSIKEDVTIGTLAVNNAQLQTAILNVNVFVPNKVLNIDGVQDATQPDFLRLKQLTRLAVDNLTEIWGLDYSFTIESQSLFQDDESNSYFSNIRLEFHAINL